MQEIVGKCKQCSKNVFCLDGFLNGILLEDRTLLCFECHEKDTDRKI